MRVYTREKEEDARAREELLLDALFIVAQDPGGRAAAAAAHFCYAFDVRLCAGLCAATWAEEALWSGDVLVDTVPQEEEDTVGRDVLVVCAWMLPVEVTLTV